MEIIPVREVGRGFSPAPFIILEIASAVILPRSEGQFPPGMGRCGINGVVPIPVELHQHLRNGSLDGDDRFVPVPAS